MTETDYYIGRIGKDDSYTLISEHPFVLWRRDAEGFVGHPTIKPLLDLIIPGNQDVTVYAFSSLTGSWEEVHFATEGLGATKPALGFQPY